MILHQANPEGSYLAELEAGDNSLIDSLLATSTWVLTKFYCQNHVHKTKENHQFEHKITYVSSSSLLVRFLKMMSVS